MTTDTTQRSALLIGKSQVVLDDAVAGLRALGYKADATNDFTASPAVSTRQRSTWSCSAERSRPITRPSSDMSSPPLTRRSSSSKDFRASRA